MQRAARASNWPAGHVVGAYTILAQVPTAPGSGALHYRIYDARQQRERVLSQNTISRQGEELGYCQALCRALVQCALRRKGLTKTRSFSKHFGYTKEELQAALGTRPEKHHLDHICPLNCAQTEEEVYRLFALENLQWLRAKENNAKLARWTPEGAQLHEKLLGRPWPKPEKARECYEQC
jgi:hypothetical protein